MLDRWSPSAATALRVLEGERKPDRTRTYA
jgi:hypothetical protein